MVGDFDVLSNTVEVHEIIKFRSLEFQTFSDKIVQLYKNGLSTTDIAKQVGKATSTINSILKKAKIEMRPNRLASFETTRKLVGKRAVRPPYGFCYFQGAVVPDQNEYAHLLLIYNLWKQEVTARNIAKHLNSKNIPPRIASKWSRDSVLLILKRFDSGLIVHKGGQLEIR